MFFISRIIRFKKTLVILPSTFRHFNNVRNLKINVYKLSQFSRSGPFLGFFTVAGCCFSKEKETLLPSDSACHESEIIDAAEVEATVFETYEDLLNMKRNITIDLTVSPGLDKELDSCDVTEPQCKRVKIENDSKVTDAEKSHSIAVDCSFSKQEEILLPLNICHDSEIVDLTEETCDLPEPQSKKIKVERTDVMTEVGTSEKYNLINKCHIDHHSDSFMEAKNKNKITAKKHKSTKKGTDISESHETPNKQKERPVRQRPNYFVAVQISDDQIRQAIKVVQDHILQQEGKLVKSMISVNSLHITLMVMHIADLEAHERAMKALQNVHDEFDKDFTKNPLLLEFQGLNHFKNRVLYAKISDKASHRLTSLANGVRKHFAELSLFTEDERFTPHMTVAKIDFKQTRKGVKKIDPLLYEEFNDEYFGSERVKSIQLCSMMSPKNEEGYYSNDEIFFTGLSPKERLNSLQQILSIDEKKKDVKEIINKLLTGKVE